MDTVSALHATADTIIKFNTAVYTAIGPVAQRLIEEAAFMITS